jgi:hypothetical protein
MGYVLRFGCEETRDLAKRYTSSQSKAEREAEAHIEEVAPTIRKNGYYSKAQFLDRCYWKTPRSQPRCAANDEEFIREVTALALGTKSERLRIGRFLSPDPSGLYYADPTNPQNCSFGRYLA